MMIQATTALVIVCLAFANADVSTTCTAESCTAADTFCRVGQTTVDGVTSTGPQCLTCVAEGFDAVCNAGGFLNTVLSGNADGTWSALACGEMCPEGTTCVNGVCCYGENGAAAANQDPTCQ